MKSSHLLQSLPSLPSHPRSCLICRQPCLASHSTKLHPAHGGLDLTTLSCSTSCGNVLTLVMQAFVQGFLVSWVLGGGCRGQAWDLECHRSVSESENRGEHGCKLRSSDKQGSLLDLDFNWLASGSKKKHDKCGAGQHFSYKQSSDTDLDMHQPASETEKENDACGTVQHISNKQRSVLDSDFCQIVSDFEKNESERTNEVLHVSDTENDEQMTAKNKYLELSAGSNNSSLFFGENHEIEQMFQIDEDCVSKPVHFGVDVFLEPSLDGFIDFELATCGPTNKLVLTSTHLTSDTITSADADQGDGIQAQNSVIVKTCLSSSKHGELFNNQTSSSSVITLENMTEVSDCTEMESCHQNDLIPNGAELKTPPSSCKQLKVTVKPSVLSSNHSCVVCCKSFSSKRLLKQHLKSHKRNSSLSSLCKDTEPSFTCEFCAQSFMNQYSLKAHIRRKHSGENPVDCDICGKTQPSMFALSAHKKACHDFSSLCHICGAEFSGRTSYDKHMMSHGGIKQYFCDVCGAGFVHSTSLKTHASVHATSKCHQCHICSRMFKAQHLLNEHLLKAHQCGPSLEHRIRSLKKMGVEVDREALVRHTNHQCLVCGEALVNGECQTHPHHTQRVFCCSMCGDSTNSIILFHQHLKWHHGKLAQNRRPADIQPVPCRLSSSGDNQVIRCEVCGKTFKSLDYLSAHMHQHREARFRCHVCDKRFTYKCNLKSHLTIHLDSWPFQCEACCKKFRDKHSFKKHQLKHTKPQFTCRVCSKALTRRPYLLKHYQKMHPEYHGNVERV